MSSLRFVSSLSLPTLSRLWSWRAFSVYVGWLLLHFALYAVVPGRQAVGVPLDRHGSRLRYPLNGKRIPHARPTAATLPRCGAAARSLSAV